MNNQTDQTEQMTPQEALQVLDAATETQAYPRLTKRDHLNVVVALQTLASTVNETTRIPTLEMKITELEAALSGKGSPQDAPARRRKSAAPAARPTAD